MSEMKEIPEELPLKRIRECLKAYLKVKGMTYEDVADKLNMSLRTFTNYMCQKNISHNNLKRISEVLDYPYELLIRGEKYIGPDIYAYWQDEFQKLRDYCAGLEERIRKLESKK